MFAKLIDALKVDRTAKQSAGGVQACIQLGIGVAKLADTSIANASGIWITTVGVGETHLEDVRLYQWWGCLKGQRALHCWG